MGLNVFARRSISRGVPGASGGVLPSAFQEIGDIQVSVWLRNRPSVKSQVSFFPQLHIWRIGKFIPAQDVDGWMVALNERLGIMPTPVGAIFLIGFGHGLHDTDQSAMQLGGGQFWASYLIPCSILSGCAFRPNRIRGFRSRANGGGWDVAAEAGSGPPSVAALRFSANPSAFCFCAVVGPSQTRQRFR